MARLFGVPNPIIILITTITIIIVTAVIIIIDVIAAMSWNPDKQLREYKARAESRAQAPTTQTAKENPRPAATGNESGLPTFDKNAYRKAPAPTARHAPENPRPAVTGNQAGRGQSWKGHKKPSYADRYHIKPGPAPPQAIDLFHGGTPSLATLKPFPPKDLRHLIWCRNCYRMHDPSLCLGPATKGVIDICPICGVRHLAEECPYYTKDRMIEYCWINRQCRPPIQTRADFSQAVLTLQQKSQIVAPVQTVEFSRRREEEEWRHAMAKSVALPWKTYDYHQEGFPRQEAETARRYCEGGRVPPRPLRYDPSGRVAGGPPPTRNPKAGTKRFNVETDVSYRVVLLEKERRQIEDKAKAEAEARAKAETEAAAAAPVQSTVVEAQVMSSIDPESEASEVQPKGVADAIFPRLEAAAQSLLDLVLTRSDENPRFSSKVIPGITALQDDIRAAAGADQPTSAMNPTFARLEAASQSLLELVVANAAKSQCIVCRAIEGILAFQNEIRALAVEAKGKEKEEKVPRSSEVEAVEAGK
ncbi:hypothetical protein DL771_001626 [Monosporascus sp. 5C6A]|nr:hypothetical protein DL771_001626 [Monosporascus sp. 5C6A]